jgi:hypothetical protein
VQDEERGRDSVDRFGEGLPGTSRPLVVPLSAAQHEWRLRCVNVLNDTWRGCRLMLEKE